MRYLLLVMLVLAACAHNTEPQTAESGNVTVRTTPPPYPKLTLREKAFNTVWEAIEKGALNPEEMFISSILEGAWELGYMTGQSGSGATLTEQYNIEWDETPPVAADNRRYRTFKSRLPTDASLRRLMLQPLTLQPAQ
ncbi:MAG: hypothetical protein OXB94_09140 [Nitrospira sp.]|nr:hypothetical protein [Nitrospira sp.]